MGFVQPRFSVVIPVQDRAEVIGRAVAGVLTQTFADVEVVVVDEGSTDDTVAAVRAVADRRVQVVSLPEGGLHDACAAGLDAAHGRWIAFVEPDTEVAPAWLASMGRIIDSSGASFISCGGEHRHADGTRSEIRPGTAHDGEVEVLACLRAGAFATQRERLVRVVPTAGDTLSEIGGLALSSALFDGASVAHTPEMLVFWNDTAPEPSTGDELRLVWAYQALEAMARAPIPDAELLARYATIGGVAAARLRRRTDARTLFGLARRIRPDVRKHWARWATSCIAPLADRVWMPSPAAMGLGTHD